MLSPKYPLEPLLEHRQRKVDDSAAELGGAIRTREAAEVARLRAEAAHRDAEEAARQVKAEEAERLARGELRVVDLAREQAWATAAAAQIRRLNDVAAAASEKVVSAAEGEDEARAALARSMADRDVVAKDRTRFQAKLAAKAAGAEEEAAEEAFRGGRG